MLCIILTTVSFLTDMILYASGSAPSYLQSILDASQRNDLVTYQTLTHVLSYRLKYVYKYR